MMKKLGTIAWHVEYILTLYVVGLHVWLLPFKCRNLKHHLQKRKPELFNIGT